MKSFTLTIWGSLFVVISVMISQNYHKFLKTQTRAGEEHLRVFLYVCWTEGLFREGDVAAGRDDYLVILVEHSDGFLEVFLTAAEADLDLFGRRLFGERGSVG